MARWDEVVSRGVHDQVRWERDVAMEQLEEHGIPFGGIAPDVVKVVRCKDCVSFVPESITVCRHCAITKMQVVDEDDFCSYGERRTDERKAD